MKTYQNITGNRNTGKYNFKVVSTNPIIERKTSCSGSIICLTFPDQDWFDEVAVEGSRVGGTLPSTIQTKLSEGMNSPNGNDWFIPR
jgi:hypothetical protein